MIQFIPESLILAALLLMILPLDWYMSVLIASLFHEMCHILSVYLLNGRLLTIKVRCMGCTIEAAGLGEWRQFLSILAGPLGSFSLLILYRIAPKLAICGFIQGIFNLLPFLHLDGGRLLRIFLNSCCPKQADAIQYIVAIITCVILDVVAVVLIRSYGTGLWLIFAAVLWNVRMLPRKIPCKPWEIGVQ